MKIETVFIKVKDIHFSKEWYKNTLNLSIKWEDFVNKVVAFDLGETDLTLVQEENATIYSDATFNIFIDNIEQIHNELINKGITISQIKQWNNMYYFDFQDLDSNHLQIVSKDI